MAVKLDRSKIVTSLGAKNKLVPHLEKGIAKGDFEWEYKYIPKKGDDAWHPSGHCTPSLFELYHIALGDAEDSFGPSLYKTFQVGHFWHQFLQEVVVREWLAPQAAIERRGSKWWGEVEKLDRVELFKQGVSEGSDLKEYKSLPGDKTHLFKPQPYHWVTGSGDIAPCCLPDGKFVVDFKTMGDHDYKRQGVPDWCADKYECQINIYMDLFDLDRGLILAIQKGTPHDFKEFEYERNQPLIDAIYGKWKLVSQCLDERVEPPATELTPLPTRGPK